MSLRCMYAVLYLLKRDFRMRASACIGLGGGGGISSHFFPIHNQIRYSQDTFKWMQFTFPKIEIFQKRRQILKRENNLLRLLNGKDRKKCIFITTFFCVEN